MKKALQLTLMLLTPFFILLSHYLAVFPQEYAHSFMAWIGTSWSNLLFLAHIDENVNNREIYHAGYGYSVALIAFAGAGIANVLMFILSLYLLNRKSVKQKPYLFYFSQTISYPLLKSKFS